MTRNIDDLCRKAFELARHNEHEYTGCCQTTLAGILDALERPADEVFKAASGMADGMGLSTRGSCGALVAGALAIGLYFGRERKDFEDPLAAMDSYDLVLDLVEQFEKRFGALCCADIQTAHAGRSFDLRRPEDMEAALEAGMLDHCSGVAGTAAEIAARIILEES
ncbi:MAG: C-GCAxxG-C-C family protein [Proteobacteria bacterium]|nr:C-GCAxxG-C-C family protein [Pseudomonadota bacterium]